MRETLGVAGAVLSGLHGHDDVGTQDARLEALVAKDMPFAVEMTAPLNVGVDNMYAGHRSHSSHSSHSSHYSGSGGYRSDPYYTPPPAPRVTVPPSSYTNPSTSYISPRSRPVAPVQTLAPSSTQPVVPASTIKPDALQLLIMRVQVSLYAAGYDPGAVDGVLSEPTRQALRQYQAAKGITADGRMSTATLNALGVGLPR